MIKSQFQPSEYFKNILKQNKHKDPLLCLEGISSTELNDILDYVYHGEVYIHQENLDRFLRIADRLKLEGMMSTEEKYDKFWGQHRDMNEVENDVKGSVPDTKDIVLDTLNNSENRILNSERTKVVISSGEFQTIDELDKKILQHLERDVGKKWKCTVCNKVLREKTAAKEHFEGLQFPCPEGCDVVARSRSSLRLHISKKHR